MYAVCILISSIVLASTANAYVSLGFTTSASPSMSNFTMSNAGSLQVNLDFGNLAITEAIDNGVAITEMVGANVAIKDALIDVSSETLVTSFMGTNIYSYTISADSIDGFSIFIGATPVLTADLSFSTLVTLGKSASIDMQTSMNLSNVVIDTTGLSAATATFLGKYVDGADLTISLAADAVDFQTALNGTSDFTGVVGGTSTPVSEPMVYIFMGWGMVFLYSFRKAGKKLL